jgi:hypothetical protein
MRRFRTVEPRDLDYRNLPFDCPPRPILLVLADVLFCGAFLLAVVVVFSPIIIPILICRGANALLRHARRRIMPPGSW